MNERPDWSAREAGFLAQATTDVDTWLEIVGEKLVNQRRPRHKVRLWKALLAKPPAGPHDEIWQARHERFLDLALAGTRPGQIVRTLAVMGGSGYFHGPERLQNSLDYCLDRAQPGRQRRQVVREGLLYAFHRMMYNVYGRTEPFECMDVLIDIEQREGLRIPWLLWWAKVRMYTGTGDDDNQLLEHIAKRVDLDACDVLEQPVLRFLDSHSRARAVHWAVDQLLQAGLDWTRTEPLSQDLASFIRQHPVVLRERLGELVDASTPSLVRARRM